MTDAPERSRSNVAAHLTLHRYFLNASRNRSLFLSQLEAGRLDHPHTMVHLLLWYGGLYVVLEGWRAERINFPPVTAILRDGDRVALLRGCRNAVFHYGPDYIEPRVEALFRDETFVEWVHALHDSISAFFLGTAPGRGHSG